MKFDSKPLAMPREQTESQPVLPELFYLLKGKYAGTKQRLFLYESRKPCANKWGHCYQAATPNARLPFHWRGLLFNFEVDLRCGAIVLGFVAQISGGPGAPVTSSRRTLGAI